MIRRLPCYFGYHDWELTEFRVTHGKVTCTRCDAAEWRQN
jgi:hypothetical protein